MENQPIYSLPVDQAYQRLGTSPRGLSEEEAARRLEQYGPNVVQKTRGTPLILRFLANFYQVFALLLWVSAGLSFIAGATELGWVIIVVIFINAIFSFSQEYQAERAVEALSKMLPARARVLREGETKQILAENLVPGDLLLLEEGEYISADARLTSQFELRTNNAALTGESEPVKRTADPVLEPNTPEIEAINLVFAGTSVASGSGRAVIFATGMRTQFGNIARLTQGIKQEQSPLQKQVNRTAIIIAIVALVLGVVFFAVGTAFAGLSVGDSLIFAIGIIVANVPEGLLPTVTLALALAVRAMAREHALVKRLSGVETLGSTTVIATDKTGTLTQNAMTVRVIWTGDRAFDVTGVGYAPEGEIVPAESGAAAGPTLQLFLRAVSFANNARLNRPEPGGTWSVVGDPTEAALLVAALKGGFDYNQALTEAPRVFEIPFDSRRRRMTTIHQEGGGRVAYTKGAIREVMSRCTTALTDDGPVPLDDRLQEEASTRNDAYAGEALRVLAVAYRRLPEGIDIQDADKVEADLVFLGLVGMMDPPRPQVAGAVKVAQGAGIRIIMITGDYGLTAKSIALKIGIISSPAARVITGAELEQMDDPQLEAALREGEVLFARAAPEDKLRIAAALRDLDETVAMTGDGVNDAPALKRADIGVAMGVAGTDVAKEAAEMILTDDNFATIVAAVRLGRAVFENIRKFTVYIFAHLTPEAIPFILLALFRVPLAITPLQILAIDLGTETLPALSLGAEPPEPGTMERPPRPRREPLLTVPLLIRAYIFLGLIETVFVLAGFFWVLISGGWTYGQQLAANDPLYLRATTMSFLGIVATQVGTVFAVRTQRVSVFQVGLFSNRLLLWGVVFEIAVTLVLLYVPPIAEFFGMYPLGWQEWLFVVPFAPAVLAAEELRKWISRRT
ncbi:MAG: cation-translocating P-type ATPase [Chloroflexota bacterium]